MCASCKALDDYMKKPAKPTPKKVVSILYVMSVPVSVAPVVNIIIFA